MKVIDPYKYTSTVILGNGEYPQASLPCSILDKAQRVVLCDGAANRYVPSGRPFDIIIGDGDSIDEAIRRDYSSRIIISDCQETNDQTKAVNYLAAQGTLHIAIVGATGRRDDHSLGNISLLIDYLKQGITAYIYTDYGIFIPAHGDSRICAHEGQQISIFNFGSTRLEGENLKYPIRPFDTWWQGTLNEVTADHCIIRADGYYLIYLAGL